MSPRIEHRLNEFKEDEFKNIQKEKELCLNHCFAFTDLGGLGEELVLYMYPDSYGSASKGGCAFDNKNIDEDGNVVSAREVKVCSLDGSKECISKKCKDDRRMGHKAPAFQPKCIYCSESKFKTIHDSRCSISTKPHIEWAIEKDIMKEYILFTVKYNEGNDSISMNCWKIMSDNEYFKDYIVNQHEKGDGGSCNCVPYSIDFHLSGPISLFEIELFKDRNEVHNYDLSNMKNDDIPYRNNNKNTLRFKYCEGVNPFIHEKIESIDYIKNINKFKLKSGKKTCLGKVRGKTTRA